METIRKFKKQIFVVIIVIILLLASIFIIPIIFPPIPSITAVTTLRPNAAGTYQQWTLYDSTHWGATSDQIDSTCVYTADTTAKETENLADSSETGSIDSVAAYVRAKVDYGTGTAESLKIRWRTHDTDYESGSKSISRTTITNYYETRTVNPYTSVAWTWTEVNALQTGARAYVLGADESIDVYEFWIVVTYSPVDTTLPTYSDVDINTTQAGMPCLFSTKWTDETGLATTGGYIFGTNNTGTFTNETWTAFTANPDWSNATKTLNATFHITIQWQIWVNDTSNNWNNTGINSFETSRTTELWVESFDATEVEWTEVGESPYLDDDESSYICAPTLGANESWFTFNKTNVIAQQAILWIYAINVNVTVTLFNGESNYTYDVDFFFEKMWQNFNVTNAINSQTKANNVKMKITAKQEGGLSHRIYRCYIRVFSGGVYDEVYASDLRATYPSIISVLWKDPDGMSTYAFNHNASGSWLENDVTGSLSGTESWSNETITLPSDSTGQFDVQFWANDTNNNWETTGINTFSIIDKFFNEAYMNNVGQSGTVSTQHSYGRNSFYINSTGLYIQLWHNGTHQVYSTTKDGKTWNFHGALRERETGPGFWYSYHEYRNGVNYLHYQYSNELSGPIYYRRGTINSDGSITFSTPEQIAVNHTGLQQNAVNGLCTDYSGHVFLVYYWKIDDTHKAVNITCSNATDGTWMTHSGYPKLVSSIGNLFHEAYVVPLLSDWDVYIVYTTNNEVSRGRRLTNNVLQSIENISISTIHEARMFSVISDFSGNVHFVYTESSQLKIRYCFWNYTSQNWDIQDEIVSPADCEYPIIEIDYGDNIFVNWAKDGEYWVNIRNVTDWQGRTRLFIIPDDYYLAKDPNVITPHGLVNHALLGFHVRNKNGTYYQWVYLYMCGFTSLSIGWNVVPAWTIDIDKTLGLVNASLNLNSVNWTVIIIDYQNSTMWELIWDQTEDKYYGDSTKIVNSISDIIAIYCNEAGGWSHEYS